MRMLGAVMNWPVLRRAFESDPGATFKTLAALWEQELYLVLTSFGRHSMTVEGLGAQLSETSRLTFVKSVPRFGQHIPDDVQRDVRFDRAVGAIRASRTQKEQEEHADCPGCILVVEGLATGAVPGQAYTWAQPRGYTTVVVDPRDHPVPPLNFDRTRGARPNYLLHSFAALLELPGLLAKEIIS